MNKKLINSLRWASLLGASLLPALAWAQYYSWQIFSLGSFQIFGLLGITAWLIMATHFLLHGLTSSNNQELPKNRLYTTVSGHLVLLLLLLHPAILYIKQFSVGNGLPPNSSINYVGQENAIFIAFGTVALLIFLAYELWRYMSNKSFYIKNYFWIFISQYLAMFLIFMHANQLGAITNSGWFSIVWVITGLFVALSALVTIPYEWAKYKRIK